MNHDVDTDASPLELEIEAVSVGDKIDNILFDLIVILASLSFSVSAPFDNGDGSSVFLMSRLFKKSKNEDFVSSLGCTSSPPFSILSERFKELDFDLVFSFIVLKYNYKIFNDLDFYYFINILLYKNILY
jgi:hypothetical protein